MNKIIDMTNILNKNSAFELTRDQQIIIFTIGYFNDLQEDIGINLLDKGIKMYEELLDNDFEMTEEETINAVQLFIGPLTIQ